MVTNNQSFKQVGKIFGRVKKKYIPLQHKKKKVITEL